MYRVDVYLPIPVNKAYSYTSDSPVVAGQVVRVSFRKKEVFGVAWSSEFLEKEPSSPLKPLVLQLTVPPLPQKMRDFCQWMASYTMTPLGFVLKMAMPPSELPASKTPTYGLAPGCPSLTLTRGTQKIVLALQDGVPRTRCQIAQQSQVSLATVTKFIALGGLVMQGYEEGDRGIPIEIPPPQKSLSPAQEDALSTIQSATDFSTLLLDGVTGSGKTEVYFEWMADLWKQGKQILVLLPEIALSQQWIQRFEERFQTTPWVWHSDVTPSKKRALWDCALQGKPMVVVGARSALFLPFANLGAIIVDEEHDPSFKQEEGGIYHGRDMAIVRARFENIPILLASATPSLETWENALKGKYTHIVLPQRFGNAVLPKIRSIDMRSMEEKQVLLSPSLREAVAKTLDQGHQSLLFINRRGYAPLTLCRSCGFRFQCPSCSGWLVMHKNDQRLKCHHCSYTIKAPHHCPQCQDTEGLLPFGAGIERVLDEVHRFFPQARCLVMSSDTMTSPKIIQSAIAQIQNHEVDILIGTQLIAKGYDFPLLTCVGVVDADLGLHGGDLRAGERTFQLLQQVAGRAGRDSRYPGEVLLQTFSPHHPLFQALMDSHTPEGREVFFHQERHERQSFHWPPYGRLASLILSGRQESVVAKTAQHLGASFPVIPGVRLLGPAQAPLYKVRGNYRWRLLVKSSADTPLFRWLEPWQRGLKLPGDVTLKIDIDPISFF